MLTSRQLYFDLTIGLAVATAVSIIAIALFLTGCSYPLRMDSHRADLEKKQDICLTRGGSPKDCRP